MHIFYKYLSIDRNDEKMAFSLGILVVVLLIIILYIGFISFLIFLLSLIPVLNITIDNWLSLFAFSLCIIVWLIPYVLISIFQSIPIKNKLLKRLTKIISELLSTFLFTLYVLFLDKHFINLSFSTFGIISIVISIIFLSVIINEAGERLKNKKRNIVNPFL